MSCSGCFNQKLSLATIDSEKMRVNFQVFLECVHPTFLLSSSCIFTKYHEFCRDKKHLFRLYNYITGIPFLSLINLKIFHKILIFHLSIAGQNGSIIWISWVPFVRFSMNEDNHRHPLAEWLKGFLGNERSTQLWIYLWGTAI